MAVHPLTGFQLGKETTAGTAVPTTRELYPSGLGYFDPGVQTVKHGGQRGRFTNITSGTLVSERPIIGFVVDPEVGASYDDLIYLGAGLDKGETGSGATADKTWAFSSTQTAHTFETFTANVFDDDQAWEVEYCFPTTGSLWIDDPEGLTQWSMDLAGRQTQKVTVDAVTGNDAVKIPAGLWTVKYATAQSGLTGASALSVLRTFRLDIDYPMRPVFNADGNLYMNRGEASTNLGGTLSMVWDGGADAETQYDRWRTQSVSFFRLRATGPTLGATAYQASFDCAVLWDEVKPMAGETEGVVTYEMTGTLTDDATWDDSLQFDLINSLAAIP